MTIQKNKNVTPHIQSSEKDRAKNVYIISIDGDPWREVHCAVFSRNPHRKFKGSTLEELEAEFTVLELARAKAFLVRCLSLRAYSSYELRKQLAECLVSDETIDKVIGECIDSGYINDEDYIRSFIRVQQGRRNGPRVIADKLRMKGIPSDVIREYLSEVSVEGQVEQIKRLLTTRFRMRDLNDPKEKHKVVAALLRKGFAMGQISMALSSVGESEGEGEYGCGLMGEDSGCEF